MGDYAMNYLILSQPSEAYAEAISRALWGIARPASVRDAKDVSELYTSWVVHPDGRVALYLPDESKPVHVDGDIDSFCGLIGNPDVTITITDEEGVESSQTLPMDDHLNTMRGGSINPLALIQSTAFTVNLKTRTEMEADGWFSSEDI